MFWPFWSKCEPRTTGAEVFPGQLGHGGRRHMVPSLPSPLATWLTGWGRQQPCALRQNPVMTKGILYHTWHPELVQLTFTATIITIIKIITTQLVGHCCLHVSAKQPFKERKKNVSPSIPIISLRNICWLFFGVWCWCQTRNSFHYLFSILWCSLWNNRCLGKDAHMSRLVYLKELIW